MENALAVGHGVLCVKIVTLPGDYTDGEYVEGQVLVFSEHFLCPDSGFNVGAIEPKLFSFNIVNSACQYCMGLGRSRAVDVNMLVPNVELSIIEGARSYWPGKNPRVIRRMSLLSCINVALRYLLSLKSLASI
ncbi:excision endonuclease subunit UvrA domain protein [Anaplasma phagocytophilum str. ApWI1]|uniref:Excision endonuclease subunit UvrA domain protein n=1 Tax=Anaplasma phagocytophilum str. ApWI1 TaxID=1359155 RepID=A0A0F3PYZ2_ANAPH|nr:hypothetical protein [Anaplasma phagocytophilum]KJV85066.1 excision endonuclease subunit UvrA domain protein [Anaplasma phagocytophilum str. ApWI1]